MSGFLFYAGTISLLFGVAVQTYLDIGLPVSLWLILIGVGLLLVGRRHRVAVSAPYVLICGVALIGLSLGLLRFSVAEDAGGNPEFEALLNEKVALEGEIVREPDVRERTQHLYTKNDDELILVMTDRYGEYAYGDQIQFEGTLTKPESFATDLGRTFNYPGYLRAQGVKYMVRYAAVDVVDRGHGHFFLAGLLTFKQNFQAVIEQIIPEPHVGLAEGLLLGEKRALGDELTEIFRKTGIIHIVVLSGYNIMLVVLFTLYVLSYLVPFRGRLLLGLGAIVAFALMVGLSATVLRASLMAALALFAKLTGQTYAVTRALFFAAAVMVLWNPYLLVFDPGFQLSFLATLGLILAAPALEQRLSRVPNLPLLTFREFLVATLATQLFVLPLLLFQIGEFSVVSVLVNVLVLPMVPVAMFLTFITGMVGFVSLSLALPFGYATTVSLAYILGVAERFASLPFAAFSVPPFPFWMVPLAYALMGWLMWRNWFTVPVGMSAPAHSVAPVELDGWVIEDEALLTTTQTGAGAVAPAPVNKPIFFR